MLPGKQGRDAKTRSMVAFIVSGEAGAGQLAAGGALTYNALYKGLKVEVTPNYNDYRL